MAEMAYGCGCLGFVGCQMAAPVTFEANRQKNADKKKHLFVIQSFLCRRFCGCSGLDSSDTHAISFTDPVCVG